MKKPTDGPLRDFIPNTTTPDFVVSGHRSDTSAPGTRRVEAEDLTPGMLIISFQPDINLVVTRVAKPDEFGGHCVVIQGIDSHGIETGAVADADSPYAVYNYDTDTDQPS